MLRRDHTIQKQPGKADRRLFWLSGFLITAALSVLLLRAVFNHLDDELRHRGANERARLFIGEEIVRGIRSIEKDVYRAAATQNRAGFAHVFRDIDAQLDTLVQDLNVLRFGGTIRRHVPLNLAEQDEYTRGATYRPDGDGREFVMEVVEIGPQLGYVRDRMDELEQLLEQRWRAVEAGDQGSFFDVEDGIAMLLKRMPPYFERLDENANRLFLDGDRRLRELDAELQGRRVVLKRIETGLIAAIIVLGGIAATMYLRRLGTALQQARDAGNEVERHREQIVTMLDTLGDGVYATDLAGNITFINAAAEHMLGWPAAALIGRSAHETMHHTRPDGQTYPIDACPLMSNIREGATLDGEEHFVTRDGRFIPVSYRSRPLRQKGEITGYLVSFQDIGSKLENQARILLQQAALDAAVNMIVITDLDGTIEYVNPSFSRTTGYTFEEAVGRKTSILHSGVHDAAFYQAMWRDIKHGLPWEGEIINRRKDGTLYQEQMSVTPIIEKGRVTHFVAVKRDVSEEARTRTRLQLVEAAVREADQGILITDVDISEQGPKILYANPAFSRITGYPADQTLGLHADVLRGPETDPDKLRAIHDTLVAGESAVVEMACQRQDGTPYVAELTFSPVRDERGNIGHYIVLLSDVSQRKAFEEALRDARDQALASVRMKSDFLSTMSHEIRTPMNGIIGMTDLLLDTNLDSEQHDFASVVRDSARALLTIIDDILDFSKIEAGRLDIETTEFSPVRIVEGATELLAAKARDKGIGLACCVDPALPAEILGDPTRVRQVLLNLIGNAIKFTDHGEVSVSACVDPSDRDHRALFEVRDTGIGISVETQERLFQSFTQADSTITRKYGGTGLGLAISKRLVELMGGHIGVRSTPGEGSRFWFTLPFAAVGDHRQVIVPATLEDRIPESAEKNVRTAIHINLHDALEHNRLLLLVEDNPTNQRVARLQINKLGYAVHTVANGQDAIEAIEAIPYAAILMDCQMPVMDGFEATAAIRRWERDKDRRVPIIAMTANAMEGDRDKCIAAGMDDYLSKPIDPDALTGILSRWVGSGTTGASSPVAGPVAVFDRNRLAELLGDDPGMLRELLGVFRSSTSELLGKLKGCLSRRDAGATKALAHEAKGACGNLGIDGMATTAEALERALLAPDWQQAESLYEELEAGFGQASRQIDEFLEESRK